MIKFLQNSFVSCRFYTPGQIAEFDSTTEAALIASGDASAYVVISKPVEVLASSAVITTCALTAVDEVLASYTIAAGVMGVNSILQIEPLWTYNNSANNKILKVKAAGVTIYTATRTTTGVKEGPLVVLANRNSLASQIQPYDNAYFITGTGTPTTYTINFASSVTIEITGQRANSGDTLKLEYYRIVHYTGA
jgi:hypothetical protein